MSILVRLHIQGAHFACGQRREWDLNPRDPAKGLTVFKTVAFVRSAIPPCDCRVQATKTPAK